MARRRISELEADLYKVPMPKFFRREMGEIERTTYDDGEERLKIVAHGLTDADGGTVSVVVDGTSIAELSVDRGRVITTLSSNEGDSIPEIREGQQVEIQFVGTPLLAGTFKPD